MRLGLALPHYDVSFPDGAAASMGRVLDYAARAEGLGFDSVYVSDHLWLDVSRYGGPAGKQHTPEAMTMLAAIAARTSRVRIGALVLCAAFRNPAILAHQVRSVSDLAPGRLDLGLGAGWYAEEFAHARIEFDSAGRRIDHLEHVAATLDEMGEGRPRIWIGGKGGPRIMRAVAAHADGWNVVWRMTPGDYLPTLETLREAAAAAGRDQRSIRRSVGLYTMLGRDASDVGRWYERYRAWAPGGLLGDTSLEAFAEGALVGTVADAADRIREFEALGVEEIVCSLAPIPFAVAADEQMEIVASDLAPLVR